MVNSSTAVLIYFVAPETDCKNLPSVLSSSGILPERSKGADLRSARHVSLRVFKPHRYQASPVAPRAARSVQT